MLAESWRLHYRSPAAKWEAHGLPIGNGILTCENWEQAMVRARPDDQDKGGGAAKPLNVMVALVTFAAMWNAKKFAGRVPPLLVGLGCGLALYYGLVLAGFGAQLGHAIGTPPMNVVVARPISQFADLANLKTLWNSASTILSGALALALIASIDALLCAKLAGEPRRDSDRLLVRLGLANVGSACLGGITSGINIGASITNRGFGGRTPVSVLVNALALLATFTLLFSYVAHLPRAVLSAVIMVIAVQHIDPWTKQLAARLFQSDTPQRGVVALDFGIALLVSILSIALNIVMAVFIGVALAVFLFVFRMSRSNIRRLYRCDSVRSRKSRGVGEMLVLEVKGNSILVIELQGALFFGSGERLAQIIESETSLAGVEAPGDDQAAHVEDQEAPQRRFDAAGESDRGAVGLRDEEGAECRDRGGESGDRSRLRSEEHTSELQSH